MNSLRSEATRLKAGLQNMANDVDHLMNSVAESVDAKTDKVLHDGRRSLHAATTRTQAFVHRRPWQVIGAVAAAAYLLGVLTRARRR